MFSRHMVLAWRRVGIGATSWRRTDVCTATFRCKDVESTSIRRIDVDTTSFWHCVPGECIVSVVVSVKVWTFSFLDYSIITDFYLKRETATNSLFWVIMDGFYPLLWSIFFKLVTKWRTKNELFDCAFYFFSMLLCKIYTNKEQIWTY